MSKLTKGVGLSGAAILIILDVLMIFSSLSLSGMDLFNQIVNNSLPVGMLLGIFAICVFLNKAPKKAVGIFLSVFFGIFIFLRLVATGFYIFELINTIKVFETTVTLDVVLSVVEYFAIIPLFIAGIFLVVYILKGKLKKVIQVLAGISIIALIVVWGICLFQLISLIMSEGIGFIQILINIYNSGLIWKLFVMGGYTMVFAALTGAMEKKA